VFMGPQTNVIPYFQSLGYEFPEHLNPADVLMDVVAGKTKPLNRNSSVMDLAARWEANSIPEPPEDFERKGSINAFLNTSGLLFNLNALKDKTNEV